MLDPLEWAGLITEFHARIPPPIRALDFGSGFGPSHFEPALLICDDGKDWVVKGLRTDRNVSLALIADHVVGKVAQLIGAPVPQTTLVWLDPTLRAMNPDLAHMKAGLCHGSLYVPECSQRCSFKYTDGPENRPRFSLLSVLYGWLFAEDHQFIYENRPPNRVHSVDHCRFFPDGPFWSIESLREAQNPFPDQTIRNECDLTDSEQMFALKRLIEVSDESIAEAVAAPPAVWGIQMPERVEMARFLSRQRDALCLMMQQASDGRG